MSLLFHKGLIQRAVSNQLAPAAELKLRAHLANCSTCRHYYDSLTIGARMLRGTLSSTRVEVERQEQRLMESLELADRQQSAGARKTQNATWKWAVGAAVPVAGLAVVALLVRPTLWPVRESPTRMRGIESTTQAKAQVLVYAQRKNGSERVRLVADLPGSGEGHLSRQDYVQFSIHHQLPYEAYVTVVGVEESGAVHTYLPRAGADSVKIQPLGPSTPLGPSVDLSASHRPGLLRLFAVLSPSPLGAQEVEEAARQAARDLKRAKALAVPGASEQVTGLFLIDQ